MNARVGWLGIAMLVGVLAWGASSQRAHAQYVSGDGLGLALGLGIAGAVVVTGQLVLDIGDAVSWAQGTPFSTGWAVFETIYAGTVLVADIVLVAAVASADPGGSGLAVGLGIVPLVLAGTSLAHAIWSFATLGSEDSGTPPPRVAVVPLIDGALMTVGGVL